MHSIHTLYIHLCGSNLYYVYVEQGQIKLSTKCLTVHASYLRIDAKETWHIA